MTRVSKSDVRQPLAKGARRRQTQELGDDRPKPIRAGSVFLSYCESQRDMERGAPPEEALDSRPVGRSESHTLHNSRYMKHDRGVEIIGLFCGHRLQGTRDDWLTLWR